MSRVASQIASFGYLPMPVATVFRAPDLTSRKATPSPEPSGVEREKTRIEPSLIHRVEVTFSSFSSLPVAKLRRTQTSPGLWSALTLGFCSASALAGGADAPLVGDDSVLPDDGPPVAGAAGFGGS